jgi:hypothetical protein
MPTDDAAKAAKRTEDAQKFWGEVSQDLREHRTSVAAIAPAYALLPPHLRAVVDGFLGIKPAVTDAIDSVGDLDAAIKRTGHIRSVIRERHS